MLKSARLNNIYSLLEKDTVTADIGCDHGLLIIEYFNNNNCDCYGVDNKAEPLNQAIFNKERFCNSSSNKLELYVADGISQIGEDVKQVVIAGMGGENIANIISNEKARQINYFVVQPNNDSYLLRDYLCKHNFKIIEELLVKEDRIIYEILKIAHGKQHLSYKQKLLGPKLLKNKNDLFIEKGIYDLKRFSKTYESIPKNYLIKRYRFKKMINTIKKEI